MWKYYFRAVEPLSIPDGAQPVALIHGQQRPLHLVERGEIPFSETCSTYKASSHSIDPDEAAAVGYFLEGGFVELGRIAL